MKNKANKKVINYLLAAMKQIIKKKLLKKLNKA